MTISNISLNGAPAHVEVTGAGSPPLLFVGGAVPAGWAEGIISELRSSHRCIYFDYREPTGWSGSPQQRKQVDLAADALAVLDHLEIPSADVLGYSRGAVAAYAAALQEPLRVRSLVLLAPVAPFRDMLIEPTSSLPSDREQMMDLLTQAAFSDAYVERHRRDARAMTQAVIDNRGTVVRVGREEEQPLDEDPPLSQPALIITSGADRLVDGAHSRRLLGAIPDVTQIVIEDGSHLAVVERPGEIARAIDSFLTNLST